MIFLVFRLNDVLAGVKHANGQLLMLQTKLIDLQVFCSAVSPLL
jgi:hypothetical protein